MKKRWNGAVKIGDLLKLKTTLHPFSVTTQLTGKVLLPHTICLCLDVEEIDHVIKEYFRLYYVFVVDNECCVAVNYFSNDTMTDYFNLISQ